ATMRGNPPHPAGRATTPAPASAIGPPASTISQPQTSARSDPQLPGTQGRYPTPNPVAANAAGCHHASLIDGARLIYSRPGESRDPLFQRTAVAKWVPAFAGAAV